MTTGARHKNIPNAVATPFPPLNFKYTGKRCPKNAASPIAAKNMGESKKSVPAHTGINPLSISPRKVSAPNFFPCIRAALVAPMLPLPDFQISSLENSFASTIEVGIDPTR